MTPESRKLTSARGLLSRFEGEMTTPSAAANLSEALSLLSDLVEDGGPESRISRNVVSVYAGKAVAAVEATLAKPGEAAAAELRQWEGLLAEFGRCGFESPPVIAVLAKLSRRLATRYVSQMTQVEKVVMLRKLEEDLGKS